MNTKTVWIIEPLEHGNGGCYGEEILIETTLEKALILNPYTAFNIRDHFVNFPIRICKSKNMNDMLYVWNINDCLWENV